MYLSNLVYLMLKKIGHVCNEFASFCWETIYFPKVYYTSNFIATFQNKLSNHSNKILNLDHTDTNLSTTSFENDPMEAVDRKEQFYEDACILNSSSFSPYHHGIHGAVSVSRVISLR